MLLFEKQARSANNAIQFIEINTAQGSTTAVDYFLGFTFLFLME